MSEFCLLLVTWPDQASVKPLIKDWLNNGLAACVNIMPTMQSIYSWEGEIQTGTEHQLVIKTTCARVLELQQRIVDQHPYECPEVLRVELQGGHEDYLSWIRGITA